MTSLTPALRMLVLSLVHAVHAHPDAGVVDGMVSALAAERTPVLGSLAEDAAAMVTWAVGESQMQLHPTSYSWDSRAGLSRGVWQLQGATGDAAPDVQAAAWLALLRDGLRRCPDAPGAPLSGGCHGAARRIARGRMTQARAILASVVR
jgi:hypothetical protein